MGRGLLEGWHLVILAVVLLVLFGGRRLPDAARGLGRSLRILKAEVRQLDDEVGDVVQAPRSMDSAA